MTQSVTPLELCELLVAVWSRQDSAPPTPSVELEAALRDFLARARPTELELQLSTRDFLAHVAQQAEPDVDLQDALERLFAQDLFVARAAAGGEGPAIDYIESTHAGALRGPLRQIGSTRVAFDDLWQQLRTHLFVPTHDRPPAVGRYAGRAPLGAWLRVVARRQSLNAVRGAQHKSQEDDSDLLALPDTSENLELEGLKRTYRRHFEDAFLSAAATLAPRQRTLLRQTFVQGLTVRELGRIYGVHHATAARWVVAAQTSLAQQTRAALASELKLSEDELESIMAMIRSRIEVSIRRAFVSEHVAADDEPEPSA